MHAIHVPKLHLRTSDVDDKVRKLFCVCVCVLKHLL